MNTYKIRTILAALVIASLVACEEVIDIDLNSSDPVLVVEGVMNNREPAWIRLSYTSDYFDTLDVKVEDGATVSISDGNGHAEQLTCVSDGLYQGVDLIGKVDQQYTITILKDDLKYEAKTKLFAPSEIVLVSFEENENNRPGQNESTYNMTMIFRDDMSANNYYLIKYQSSAEEEDDDVSDYYLIDDTNYNNTGFIEYSPFIFSFALGDELTIELYSIDEDTYIYYSEMNSSNGSTMGGSSTPFTPTSNFGSDVLGYFSAWSKVVYFTTVE